MMPSPHELPGHSSGSHSSNRQTALHAANLALTILKETLEGVPVPGLKGVVGGLLLVMQTVDGIKQNAEDFHDLSQYLLALNRIFALYKGTSDLPLSLKRSAEDLSQELSTISAQCQTITSSKLWRRVVDRSDNAQKFATYVRKIGQLLQAFQMEALLMAISDSQDYVLRTIPIADGALYNSSERELAPGCLPDTRQGVLNEIRQWLQDPHGPPVFWLTGLAGTGKSTIAHSVAELCDGSKQLGASFFFDRTRDTRNSAKLFFSTITRQLGVHSPPFNMYLARALKLRPLLLSTNSRDQFLHLILEPLQTLHSESSNQPDLSQKDCSPMVVVVDALDECKDVEVVEQTLSSILTHFVKPGLPPLKWFITSRPEPHINSSFDANSSTTSALSFVLHDVAPEVVQRDIRKLLDWSFAEIYRRQHKVIDRGSAINETWPSDAAVQDIVEKSAGLFIYASTILKFVGDKHKNPRTQLKLALEGRNNAAYSHLDNLYHCILASFREPEPVRRIVGTIIHLQDPLSSRALEALLQLDAGDIHVTLQWLQSVLLVPMNDDDPIRLFHPSFHDYLTNGARSGDHCANPPAHHADIARLCLAMMIKYLSGEAPLLAPSPQALQYACDHWTWHLCEAQVDAALADHLTQFASASLEGWRDNVAHLKGSPSVLSHLQKACSAVLRVDDSPIELSRHLNKQRNHIAQQFVLQMPFAESAGFNSVEQRCLPSTRVHVLKSIDTWAADHHAPPIFWLYGVAGTGKSTIAASISERFAESRQLAASFFFSRRTPKRNSLDLFFPTIARQLLSLYPHLKYDIANLFVQHPFLLNGDIRDQFQHLILGLLEVVRRESPDTLLSPMVIVVDALDECEDHEAVMQLISSIYNSVDSTPFLRWFITSRPEYHIRTTFNPQKTNTASLTLGDLSTNVDRDITLFLESRFQRIRERHDLPISWPGEQALTALVERASGLFIYASTALKYVEDDPVDRLEKFLLHGEINASPSRSLDILYHKILKSSCLHLDSIIRVIGTIAVLKSPLSSRGLETLLQLIPSELTVTLNGLHSLLMIPADDNQPIHLMHASFRDFLTDAHRSDIYYVEPAMRHAEITRCCLATMSMTLQNGGPVDQSAELGQSEASKYACLHWVSHLCYAHIDNTLIDDLTAFASMSLSAWCNTFERQEDTTSLLNEACSVLSELAHPPSHLLSLLSR